MASVIAAMGALMKEVMIETPKELRGRLMNICVDSHPPEVVFIDWVVLVSILSQVEIVDLHDDDDDYRDLLDHDGWEVNDDGRITTLSIGDKEDLDPFDLPAGIARLERLTGLTLWNCRSLPAKELSNLPCLQKL